MAEANKQRRKAEYLIEYQDKEPDQWNGCGLGCPPCDTSAQAVSWIKREGVNSKTYRVVRLVAGPFAVKTESVVKRTLE